MFKKYIEGKTDAITTIRALSGIVQSDTAVDVLAVICMITRVEQGDLEMDLFAELIGHPKEML